MAAEYSVASEAQEAKEAVTSVLTITTQKPKDATSQAEKTTTFPANSDANTKGGLISESFLIRLKSQKKKYQMTILSTIHLKTRCSGYVMICHLFLKIFNLSQSEKTF